MSNFRPVDRDMALVHGYTPFRVCAWIWSREQRLPGDQRTLARHRFRESLSGWTAQTQSRV